MKKVFLYASTNIHNAHRHMLENVPDGFQYDKQEYLAVPGSSNTFMKSIFSKLSPHYNYLHVLLGIPKVRKFKITGYDLIHSTQSLLYSELPYVMDFEHAAVFAGYNQVAYSNPKFVRNLCKILENKKLKKLLAWSNAAKMSLLNFVDSEEIAQKMEVLYPVVTPPKEIKTILATRNNDKIRFLFVAGIFFEKGGPETLAAFDKISSKYDVELVMVSNVPDEIKHKYSNNNKIKIYSPLPYSEVQKLYEKSHVFVLPTHYDTFGFVIPEAFSYGLPVISDNSFSRPEIVDNEGTGLLVDAYYSCFGKKGEYIYPTNMELVKKRREACTHPPEYYISSIAAAMERMIVDTKFRKRCSENAIKETTEGKFSPKVWKDKLKRIYDESIS
ncbi:MAG: glycosyltransferase family 4 protein [Candidatus Micrarchaeota archaeon]|nr:glycosyltransferase family 4 protein [Candidatus Micrarchaeota archaeon]